jgi:hypothetical protein
LLALKLAGDRRRQFRVGAGKSIGKEAAVAHRGGGEG